MSSFRGRGRGRGIFHKNMQNSPGQSIPSSSKHSNTATIHDNYCCTAIQLRLELDKNDELFLFEINNMFTMLKKSQPVIVKMQQYFENCSNPYEQTIRLLYNCKDFNSAKTKSLPYFIIDEFKDWSTTNYNKISHLLNTELKLEAFKVVCLQNTLTLIRLVVETFRMIEDNEVFLPIVKCKIDKKHYKEACQFAVLFYLQEQFTAEEILMPLILQDKLFGVDEFLNNSRRHQTELITILDGILAKGSIRDALTHYAIKLEVTDVKYDKLYAKPIKKLIARLVKTYKLSPDLTPNFNKKRNEGALQFLINKRYIENSFGDESFKEMVQEAVGGDLELQKELVAQVCQHGDVAGALAWVYFYNINKEYWPYNVRMLEENTEEGRLLQTNILSDVVWDLSKEESEKVEYHQLAIPFESIQLIETSEMLYSVLHNDFKEIDLVGIDCEWKPSFGSQRNELALMQIASRYKVFILDIISIGTSVTELWQELGNCLFNNGDILKLGFGFASDMTVIKSSLPGFNFSPKQIGFLDLNPLWQILERNSKIKFPYEVSGSGSSLSTLVHQCLGRCLNKSDQFSNWEKRPLRSSQLLYAAIDAYCLIEVYDVIRACCEKSGYPFDNTCYNLMTNEKVPKRKVKKPFKNKQSSQDISQPPSPHSTPISAQSIKVVCDSMLQGLGKVLRKCGIDTAILEVDMDHMECVRYAQDEQRYILTRGIIFNKLSGYVPMGQCLKIISNNVEEQLKQFLDYYKVEVTKENVFNICQVCNGQSFVQVSRSTMRALKSSSVLNHYHYEDELDEATGFTSDDDDDDFDYPSVTLPSTHNKWELFSDENVDVGLCQTKLGVAIGVDLVEPGVIEKVDHFYICETCGKVYWDGSHLERFLASTLRGVVL